MSQTSKQLQLEIDIIEEVRKYNFLYEKKHKDFKNNAVKLEAWKKVVEAVGLNNGDQAAMNQVEAIWKELVKQYTAYLLRLSKIPTGSAAKDYNVIGYRHSALMDFYKPNYRPHNKKNIISNFTSTDTSNGVDGEQSDDSEENTGLMLFTEEEVQDELEIESILRTGRIEAESKKSPKASKRKTGSLDEEFLEIYKKRVDTEDQYHHFGVIVANKLRKLSKQSSELASDCELAILQELRSAERTTVTSV